jgi:hypothetical protein
MKKGLLWGKNELLLIVICISSARQRLAKHVSERYAVNKNRRSLLDKGFNYNGTKQVFGIMYTKRTEIDFYTVRGMLEKGATLDQEAECIRSSELET